MCLIVGCSRKTGRDKGIQLYRVPAVVTNQGPEVEELSIERRRRWISAISRDDLTEKILNKGFVINISILEPQLLYGIDTIDWVPTLNLGHGELATRREQTEAQEARAEVKGKAKMTGGTARTGMFTKATEIKQAWSPPCRFCF